MNAIGFIGAMYGALMAGPVFEKLSSIGWTIQTITIGITYSIIVFMFFILGVKDHSD